MNAAQAITQLLPSLDPTRDIHEARPTPTPAGPYAVISTLTDGQTGPDLYRESAGGRSAQVRAVTLLVTLYGAEGWKLTDLNTLFSPLRASLADLVTEHPGYPPMRGVTRGAVLPPTPDSDTRRPLAAVRLICTYLE